MDCCPPSRRQALLWTGLAAVATTALGAAPAAHATAPDALLVTDLDVVTVTDTSVVITWFSGSRTERDRYGAPAPVPGDTELLLGDPGNPASLRTVLHEDGPTAFHYAEVHGLEPGRTYAFEARTAGRPAQQSSLQFPGSGGSMDLPGVFTTLQPPPGRPLFTIALANDTHIGEQTSGIVHGAWPPSFQQDPGLPPYPEVMLGAMLEDLRRPDRGADVLVVAGDLTSEARPADVARVRQLLDGWGTLGTDYFVARGNHDRPHVGDAYAGCTPVSGAADHHDCWGDVFTYRRQALTEHEVGGLRLIGLDTTTLDAPGGTLEEAQFAELARRLRHDKERPTLLFGHHPVTYESAVTTAAGPSFDLDQHQARRLEALYRRTPGVFLHHSGHTHRNKRTFADDAGRVEFLEVGAVKEYPGGYTLVRLYTGGYQVTFHKTRSDLARRWSQRSRAEYFGVWPHYTLGTIADRNHTVVRDLSGLTRPTGTRTATGG
ncbi:MULTISPECIES: metallophosphoesterase family protein [Streptomycetaceae]|uniref:Metallophosphoesterase n=1 Tax=Streptantibioticus cattleyicolor (strain ATCC 35852 / DSM 46488 / JCM 4925 / NBRC 14057 / NRRL 8057) TaxID=1003195 RepID=F8K300_STREN|nr:MULTISPECIES: metallophosphoesterase [Streptomycetaceae]AEW92489.1 metallophosphoesterase [Streptantibioticus cattleyicolor NRRL 8057 = DSM 46488]MYS57292.1 phosphohydrolase [Streptomyces sp. SID5468]CCB72849.1 putative secreted protein [Streptantibioticus cattleyicolor NRRL 8057 = DSM 46488]